MKAIAEKLCFDLLARLAPAKAGDQIVVLCYHGIVPRGAGSGRLDRFTVYQEDFDAHIQVIKQAGFAIINPAQVAGYQGKGVVITFDDNLSSHVTYALPILQSHGATATFFLNPSLLNVDGQMSDADVTTLLEAGMIVGAHNARHLIVANMEPEAFENAIDICTEFLDKHQMGKFWAYPGGYLGSFTDAQDQLLRQHGFVRFSTLEGSCNPSNLDGPQSRYVLRINSSLKYVRAVLQGRMRILAKFKQARFALEQVLPGLARN